MKDIAELGERIRLALKILRDKDTSIVRHVRREVGMVDTDVVQNLVDVTRVFCLEGYSGGAAPIAISMLSKVLAWEPLAPLTGDDDEWDDMSACSGSPLWQNKRCSRVFKKADGTCFDVQGIVFVDKSGVSWTSRESCVPVTFPYTPKTEYVQRGE